MEFRRHVRIFCGLWIVFSSVKSDVPLSPSNVRVECLNFTAKITFTYDETPEYNLSLPHEFRVQYNENPEEEPHAWNDYIRPVKVLNNSEGSQLVQLHPFGTFAFRMIARNQYGDSAPGYPEYNEFCATPPAKPQKNPAKVHTKNESTSQNALVVCWQAMQQRDWCGPEFHYVVEYNLSDEPQEKMRIVYVHEGSCATISDQPVYKQYDIRVWAANSMGRADTEPEAVKGWSAEGRPLEFPQNFELSKSNTMKGNVATFKWIPVPEAAVQGKLRSYKIKYWTENDQNKNEAIFGPTETEGTIDTLTANATNHAAIYIENSSGQQGPSSQTISFFMSSDVPSKVTCLRATVPPSGIIKVSWKAPFSFNDAPVGYLIEWCKCKGKDSFTDIKADKKQPLPPNCYRSSVLGPQETEYYIFDVIRYTGYAIRMAAISASGMGEWSTVKATVGSVANLEASAVIKPELRGIVARRYDGNMTWTLGNDVNEKTEGALIWNITAFIKYKKRDSDNWRIIAVPPCQTWIFLTGLCPGTFYNAEVIHLIESQPEVWSRLEFSASFGTAEPRDTRCIEEGLQ